jgi:ribosome-associated protein
MNLLQLQALVVDALEDVKAQDIQVYNTSELSNLFDRVVIASATSNRQTRALANNVRTRVKEAGHTFVASEGEETGEWVLVDLGDIVVHIMQPMIRSYYKLEEIWGKHPVRAKPEGASKKPAAKKAAAKKPTAKTASAKTPAAKAPATKAPASKVSAAKKPAAKKPAAKKAAAKAPAKKAAARE